MKCGSFNLNAKRKRMSIVFATLLAAKQGECRAEQAQATADDYATGAEWREVRKAIVIGVFLVLIAFIVAGAFQVVNQERAIAHEKAMNGAGGSEIGIGAGVSAEVLFVDRIDVWKLPISPKKRLRV